jgi:hypothetical protein
LYKAVELWEFDFRIKVLGDQGLDHIFNASGGGVGLGLGGRGRVRVRG